MPALEIIALDTTTPQLRAPSAADTYTAPRAMDITPVALTGSSATSSLSIAQTWNTTGTPTAIDLNVTDTASNVSSLLMNLRVGGVSMASVTKIGVFSARSSLVLLQSTSGTDRWAIINAAGFAQRNSAFIGWGAGASDAGGAPDLTLYRDAANTLAQRNGVNAQAFRVYNSFTDASNGEWLGIRWSGNDMLVGVQANGTGTTNRQIHFSASSFRFYVGSGANIFAWNMDAAGNFVAQVGAYMGLTEMTAPAAPATNGVRIFAQDNGAGKTQLMALFATGAAQQLAIEP